MSDLSELRAVPVPRETLPAEARRLRRLLMLLAQLPRVPHPNQTALAADFGVDLRTIRRDASVLEQAGLARASDNCLWLGEHEARVVDRLVLGRAPGSSLAPVEFAERARSLA